MTAAESIAVTMEIDSFSVDLLPKRIIVPPIQSGLGTIANTVIPLLEAYECNTGLTRGGHQSIYNIGPTPGRNDCMLQHLGCALHYSTTPPNRPEHFYHKPDDESTFTAATTTTGNSVSQSTMVCGLKIFTFLLGKLFILYHSQ